MTGQRDFAAALAKTCHSAKEVHRLVEEAYPRHGLSLKTCYRIAKLAKSGATLADMADKRKNNAKKTVICQDVIERVRADLEENNKSTLRELATRFSMSPMTMLRLVRNELHFTKKCARWIPEELNQKMKEERLECSAKFVEMAQDESFLDKIVTMDESPISLHTPESRRQSQQWLPKGQPGPAKAKLQDSREKRMLFAYLQEGNDLLPPSREGCES